MAIKLVQLSMDWNDSGAVCLSSSNKFACPRCETKLQPNVEHRCGDQERKSPKARRASRKGRTGKMVP